ncbi:MAG: asparagine synthase (glutamine-hydrolyzing) [Nanoarchaeota archaeon]
MCGICGFSWEDKKLIELMKESIKHRGPDSDGIFLDNVSLGFQRLAIIDLSEKGKQPMSNEKKDIWIVFNGEIYNYLGIRKELEMLGYKFNSNSDTEVIIHAYERWGYDCVNKLDGMWAFCIYDKSKNIFFLSRDRFGEKPLYYYNHEGKFILASEIKAILNHNMKRELNKPAISSFLSYRYVFGEETFFRNIHKLLPAHNLIYNLTDKKIERIWEYWDLKVNNRNFTEEDAKKMVEDELIRCVRSRKISDVPIGVILSGGLDSSIIAALLAKSENIPINTFTVKVTEKGFDETEFARIVSEKYKTNHFEVQISAFNLIEIMKEYTKYKDEPIGVPNEIALYLLAKKIKENVTVVLSGEGADEIFEGYGRIFSSIRDYYILKKIRERNNEALSEIGFSNLNNKYGKTFNSEFEHFLFMYNYWTNNEKDFILKEDSKKDYSDLLKKYFDRFNVSYQKKISYIFLKLHLPGLLNRLDCSTMANSVEGRVPFLSPELVQLSFDLPSELKTKWIISEEERENLDETCDTLSENRNISKYILKEIAKNHLPGLIISRKKQGFPLPLDKWFKEDFLDITKKFLLGEDSKIKNMVDQEKLTEWIEKNKNEGEKFGQKLWMLLSLELWLKEWFPEL